MNNIEYFECKNCGKEIYLKRYSHHYHHNDAMDDKKCDNPWPKGMG